MKLGLIARADDTGLGTQTREFARHMAPYKTMVVDVCRLSPKTLDLHPEWYENSHVVPWPPTRTDFDDFLEDLDVVYVAESPYSNDFYAQAASYGVRTVTHINWEMFNQADYANGNEPTLFASPSTWHYQDIPFRNKVMLPVPIPADRWGPFKAAGHATRFLHVVGHPATEDRNGTKEMIAALSHVKSEITITLRCQDPGYLGDLAQRTPDNVTLVIDSSYMEDYWDLYQGEDVLVMPRRYGGLCLPAQEAIGAGMPVIMPRISPNEWLPDPWLVSARPADSFMARRQIELYRVNPRRLAGKIDQFASWPGFYGDGVAAATHLAQAYSWEALKPRYEEVLFDPDSYLQSRQSQATRRAPG